MIGRNLTKRVRAVEWPVLRGEEAAAKKRPPPERRGGPDRHADPEMRTEKPSLRSDIPTPLSLRRFERKRRAMVTACREFTPLRYVIMHSQGELSAHDSSQVPNLAGAVLMAPAFFVPLGRARNRVIGSMVPWCRSGAAMAGSSPGLFRAAVGGQLPAAGHQLRRARMPHSPVSTVAGVG